MKKYIVNDNYMLDEILMASNDSSPLEESVRISPRYESILAPRAVARGPGCTPLLYRETLSIGRGSLEGKRPEAGMS